MTDSIAPRSEVRIREVVDGDLAVFYEQQRDPEAVRMAAFPARDRASFTAHWTGRVMADPAVLARTVTADGEVAGHLVCWEESGRSMLGYWFGRRYWGRGIATEGLALFLGQVRRRPLFADPVVHNIGSVRVLEKCGFRHVPPHEAGFPLVGADGVENALLVLES